jgi:hypothetical protein
LTQGGGIEAVESAPAKISNDTTVRKEENTKKQTTKETEEPKKEIEEPTTPLPEDGE